METLRTELANSPYLAWFFIGLAAAFLGSFVLWTAEYWHRKGVTKKLDLWWEKSGEREMGYQAEINTLAGQITRLTNENTRLRNEKRAEAFQMSMELNIHAEGQTAAASCIIKEAELIYRFLTGKEKKEEAPPRVAVARN